MSNRVEGTRLEVLAGRLFGRANRLRFCVVALAFWVVLAILSAANGSWIAAADFTAFAFLAVFSVALDVRGRE